MATIKKFEELEVFQTARRLTRLIYEISSDGLFSRGFGLRDQMRRAAVSILSNIAEGFESRTKGLFIEFLGRARGSAGEFRAQCYVALDVGYLDEKQFSDLFDLTDKCSRQLTNFTIYLKENRSPSPRNSETRFS